MPQIEANHFQMDHTYRVSGVNKQSVGTFTLHDIHAINHNRNFNFSLTKAYSILVKSYKTTKDG